MDKSAVPSGWSRWRYLRDRLPTEERRIGVTRGCMGGEARGDQSACEVDISRAHRSSDTGAHGDDERQ